MAKDKGSFGQNAGKPGVVYILCEMVDHHKMGKRKTDLYKIGESTQGGKVRAKRLTDDAKDQGSNVYYEFITETATLDCYGAEQLVFKKLKEFRQGDFWEDGGHEFFKFNNEQQVQHAIKVIRETCAEVDDKLNQDARKKEDEHKRQESKKTETERPRKFRTHYDNLKIARNAPDALIKAAYKVLLQQHHPDKVEVAKQAEALRITHIIRGSYDVLSDPVQRAEHDAWIKLKETQSRNHNPEQPDINVNEAREKEEFRRRETEKEEAEKQREQEARDKEDLRRREAEQAQRAYDAWTIEIQEEAEKKRQAQEKKAKNKTGCFPWIICIAVICIFLIVIGESGKNNQTTVSNSSYQPPSAPVTYVQPTQANRYQDNGDGTVKDLETNLEWMRCSLGQNLTSPTCEGEATKYNWSDALDIGKNFNFAGHSDWHVPAIDELKTLIYCSSGQPQTWSNRGEPCKGNYDTPTILSEVSPNTPSYGFWSSSPFADGSRYYAWVVSFSNGYSSCYDKSHRVFVRLVRG